MSQFGFRFDNRVFRHEQVAPVQWAGYTEQWLKQTLRTLREAWRQQRFSNFLNTRRRESAALRGHVSYSEEVSRQGQTYLH